MVKEQWGRAVEIRCDLNFKGGPGAHSADKGEERRKKIPKKRKQARAKTETQKNKMFLENFHCLLILLNIKWKVENGNRCHPSKIRVRSGKSKSQYQPVIS